MAESASKAVDHAEHSNVTREALIAGLNEDLAREYQAIITYVVYSQVLRGAEYMNIAGELEVHAAQELKHALAISKQLDYFNATPTVQPKPVKAPNSNTSPRGALAARARPACGAARQSRTPAAGSNCSGTSPGSSVSTRRRPGPI